MKRGRLGCVPIGFLRISIATNIEYIILIHNVIKTVVTQMHWVVNRHLNIRDN